MTAFAVALTLARALHLAALGVGFGSLMGFAVLPRTAAPAIRRLARFALGCALLAMMLWATLEAATIAEIAAPAELPSAVWRVMSLTWFGHVMIARLVLVALAFVLTSHWPRTALIPAGLALAGHAAIGHAIAGETALLLIEPIHLLAAGAWLGALPALLLALREPDAAQAAWRYARLGLVAVLLIVASSAGLGLLQAGGIGGLIGTDYGRMMLLKLVLLSLLLGMAVANRKIWAPRIVRYGPGALRRAVGIQLAVGLLIVIAAATLASLPPAAHEQPEWPFAWRPSTAIFEAAAFDPILALEPVLAFAAVLITVFGCGLALWRQRWRGAAFSLFGIAAIFAAPHFSTLFVEAYPTSYYQNPTAIDADTVKIGRALFLEHCAICHGRNATGDGPAAKSLPVPPADLTAEHLLDHADGELFWWIGHGIVGPPGPDGTPQPSMPSFAGTLDDDQIWQLIDYLHANNPWFAISPNNRNGAPHVHSR